jgi:hypothetical protein
VDGNRAVEEEKVMNLLTGAGCQAQMVFLFCP